MQKIARLKDLFNKKEWPEKPLPAPYQRTDDQPFVDLYSTAQQNGTIAKILELVADNHGVYLSCDLCGVTYSVFHRWMKNNKELREALNTAKLLARDRRDRRCYEVGYLGDKRTKSLADGTIVEIEIPPHVGFARLLADLTDRRLKKDAPGSTNNTQINNFGPVTPLDLNKPSDELAKVGHGELLENYRLMIDKKISGDNTLDLVAEEIS